MRNTGWYDKPNVEILEGRWQDFLQVDVEADETDTLKSSNEAAHAKRRRLGKFDIVYFDTFEEGYRGGLIFYKHVPGLLAGPNSRFSFFQGFGRSHPFVYKVTCLCGVYTQMR
jgi:protein arginine N-methyltransferase 2